jgi:hypothetical protein
MKQFLKKTWTVTKTVASKTHAGATATGKFAFARSKEAEHTLNKFAPKSKGKIRGVTGQITFK